MKNKFTTIEATLRAKAGKGAARATRRSGLVPAVIYGGKKEPSLIALDPRIIERELQHAGWQSRIFQIKSPAGMSSVLMREIQFHPVTDRPLHVDFMRLSAGEQIRVTIQIVFTGEDVAPGVKRGGVVNVVRHDVEVTCQVEHIPETFTVDLSGLDIHDNVRWSDLQGTEHVVPVQHGDQEEDFVIATIAPPSVEVPEQEAEAQPEGEAEG